MEENVRRELEALEAMVLNWKREYLEYATPEGNNDFLVEELQEEITTYMSPYLRRLFQCEYLTQQEADEFLSACYSQVEVLRAEIRELETPPAKPGIWHKFVTQTRIAWRKEP
jgi:hypothetical protein